MIDVGKIKTSIDWAIQKLQILKEKITEETAHLYTIEIREKRNLDPVTKNGEWNASGFRQTTGIVLSISVEDKTLMGKILGEKK